MPESDHELTETAEIAKRALVKMAQLDVPVTPENYHVWFDYFTGANEELATHIDALIESGEPFERAMNEHLYAKYVAKEKDKALIQEIHTQTQRIIKGIFEEILKSNEFTSGYRKKLEDYSLELDTAEELPLIQNVIKNLVKDTHQMAESSNRLQERLEEAKTHTESLREKLEQTEREAMKDALTGLNNRKAFDRKIKDLHDIFAQGGETFSAIMLDVDFFKSFNDKWGHKIGDEVLRKVGDTLHDGLKGGDFPARYGGEEFVVLLPRTTLHNARIVAEQIRRRISEKKLKRVSTGESLGTITVSLGVSQMREGDTVDSMVDRADKALYLAKQSGRNNVKSEEDLS